MRKMGIVALEPVSGEDQIADLFTKAVPLPRFRRLSRMLGVFPRSEYEVLLDVPGAGER